MKLDYLCFAGDTVWDRNFKVSFYNLDRETACVTAD